MRAAARTALLCMVAACVFAADAAAQCLPPLLPPEEQPRCTEEYPRWTGEMAALGANALLGGMSAGVLQKVRGGDFTAAFVKGLAGGAVVYGGKRIAVERFGGAGLVGREVAAVGASMVRNASDGRGLLSRVVLPVGPVWLYVENARVRPRLDLYSSVWLAAAAFDEELRFDAASSLSAGAPVFRTDNRIILSGSDSVHAGGLTQPGIIFLADVPAFGREVARLTFEHERVHVLQLDQIFLTVTDHAEDAVLTRLPWVRRIEPWIDVNLSSELLSLIASGVPKHLNRPWETEAIFLAK